MSRGVLTNIHCVVQGNTTRPTRIAWEDGVIVARDDACPDTWPQHDGKGLLALPGVIDPHTHFDDPGYTAREDFAHGSRGAIAGGVTTICDMPDTSIPPVTSVEALHHKKKAIAPRAYCDYALWGGISRQLLSQPDWRETAHALWREGIIGFKIYTFSGMETFGHLSYNQCDEVCAFAADNTCLVGVHAEDADIIRSLTEKYRKEGTATAYAASRPVRAETCAVEHVGQAAQRHGTRLHIVHLSSGSAANIIRSLQQKGVDISAETCPQYLAFTSEDMTRIGSALKCAPPVKSAEENAGLWAHLGTTISFLATDHAPAPDNEKNTGDFFTDYAGMPGVELLLPFALTYGYHSGRLTLEHILNLTSATTAKRFQLAPRKGSLEPGADADIALVDCEKEWQVQGKNLHSRGHTIPWEGMSFQGKVSRTYLRGTCVYDDGECAPPHGIFIPRLA